MNKPDKNGRYSLSGREYYALRELFAAVDGFNRNAQELEKRVRTIPNGYRDLRMLQSVSAKLMQDILETVPVKKLAQIRRELENSEMILRVKPVNPKENEYDYNLTYVPQQALERICRKAIELECFCCEKKSREAKKCQLRKDIQDTYMFDYPNNGKACPFAGATFDWEEKSDGTDGKA